MANRKILTGIGIFFFIAAGAFFVLFFVYPFPCRPMTPERVCNSKMGEIKKAAEAYFLACGKAPVSCADLERTGYLKGLPSNPHRNGPSNNYAISIHDGAGLVTCRTGHVGFGFDGTVVHTGHERSARIYLSAITVIPSLFLICLLMGGLFSVVGIVSKHA
jgi:hypothetical protein